MISHQLKIEDARKFYNNNLKIIGEKNNFTINFPKITREFPYKKFLDINFLNLPFIKETLNTITDDYYKGLIYFNFGNMDESLLYFTNNYNETKQLNVLYKLIECYILKNEYKLALEILLKHPFGR